MTKETYLGDAVYASFDGYNIWLRTSDGIRYTNEVALEPAVFDALVQFRARLLESLEERYHGDIDGDGELT